MKTLGTVKNDGQIQCGNNRSGGYTNAVWCHPGAAVGNCPAWGRSTETRLSRRKTQNQKGREASMVLLSTDLAQNV